MSIMAGNQLKGLLGLVDILKKKWFKRNQAVVIVSGLPRSGTSMLMQMLDAGGLAVKTDQVRAADKDNPKGYFEYEKTKTIKEDAAWIDGCEGRAIKIVSPLLSYLPAHKNYKVLFLLRDLDEILSSQMKMMKRMGTEDESNNDEDMKALFYKHLVQIREWIHRQPNVEVLYLNYRDVVLNPTAASEEIRSFLKVKIDTDQMSKKVERSLYRQRGS